MFYNENQIKKLKKNNKLFIIYFLVSFLILIGLIIGSTFLVRNYLTLIKIVDSIVVSIYFLIVVYILINIVIANGRRINLIRVILKSNENKIKYDEVILGSLRTINHAEKAYEVTFVKDGKKTYAYFDEKIKNKIDLLEDNNTVIIKNNYVVEILNEKDN